MEHKSGITGVSWDNKKAKWQSKIMLKRVAYSLGSYATIEEARIAREQAEERIADGTFLDWYERRMNRPRYEDLTGQRFGRLIAVTNVSKKGKARWICTCDCGNEVSVAAHHLKSGGTRSCGCLHSEVISTDLAGRRFGWLLVLERTEKRSNSGSTIWKCQCDCGNIVEVDRLCLTRANTKSCGCRMHTLQFVDGTYVARIQDHRIRKNNTSGYTGVYWNKHSSKWTAMIKFKGKQYYLGYFENISEAVAARKHAEEQLHGPFLKWYEEYIKGLKESRQGGCSGNSHSSFCN